MPKKRSFQKFVQRLDEMGLLEPMEKRATALQVSLKDLYEGPGRGTASVSNARRSIYLWLNRRKGINEIARLFDRAPGGVFKLMRSPPQKTRGKK